MYMAKSKMTLCRHCGKEIAKGAKICPYCGGKNKAPFFKRPWFIVLVVLILLVGVGGGAGGKSGSGTVGNTRTAGSGSDGSVGRSQKAAAETVPVTYLSCSIDQMMEDLSANALKAQETYKKQNLEITGRLGAIDSSGKYISLLPEGNPFAIIGVRCELSNDDLRAKVARMNKDDIITLRGQCTDVGEVLGFTVKVDSIDGYDTDAASSDAAAAEMKDGYLVCTADQLADDLSENALKAQMTYKGQKLELTGKLSNIDSNGAYFDLAPVGSSFSLSHIQCYIKTEEQKMALMELTIGDIVTIRGTCKDVGELLGYSVDLEK